jgi:hypothetical protein
MESSRAKKLSRLKWILPVILLGVLTTTAFFPARDWSDKVTQALEQFGKNYPQEKVYLHVDKDYYASGETIWFKAYIMVQGLPSLGASNLYAELLDKNGTVVMKKRLLASGASAAGEFQLPETTKAGQYQIRAYTSWMLNFDPAFLGYRNIEVFDPQKRNSAQAKDSAVVSDFSVQFFPEGGDLLNNVNSIVAFKAIDQSGYPVAVSGNVQNSKGKTLATLQTIHDGMGSFELTPDEGENYHAIVKTANGKEKTIVLPAAKSSGAGLKVYNWGSRIFYQTSLPNMTDTSYDHMLIVGQMQQQLVYKAILHVSDGRISGFIPTGGLPSGILQITLFSMNGTPLSERLAFVSKEDHLKINLVNESINTDERAKNSVEIEIPDTLRTSISVAVTDADQVLKDPDENNIISGLLLTSDLKGFIYNPAWYFRDTTKATLDALDLVMMTNGWRRFSWEKIINNDLPQIRFPYEQGILIKGTAFSGGGRVPLSNGKVDMILKHPLDSTTNFTSVNTDDKGEFSLANVQFMDTLNIYYKGSDKNKSPNVIVKYNSHFFDNTAPVQSPYPYRVPAALDKNLLVKFLNTASENNKVNRAITNRTILLKEVNIKEKKITPQETIEKRYVSGMFTSDNGYTFDLTKETPTSFNVFQYLQSKVAGLQITGDYSNPTLSWRGGTPTLYMNEMPTDKEMISTLNINDIALIKVFRPPFMGGFGGGAGGAIAIYTKKGGDNTSDESVRGFELYKKGGYTLTKEFYSPDYSVRNDLHALADKRLTLYWNPRVQIDSASHKAKITFYNNDFTSHFRVVVEGFSEDGRPGRAEMDY